MCLASRFPPYSSLEKRDVPLLETSFIHLSKCPVYEPPSRFQSGAPMERDARLQSLFYTSSRVPNKAVPPPGSPHETTSHRDAPFLEPSSSISQSPGKLAPFQVPQWGPYGERCPSPEPFLHNLHPSFKVPGT